jgi:hypothetical protein
MKYAMECHEGTLGWHLTIGGLVCLSCSDVYEYAAVYMTLDDALEFYESFGSLLERMAKESKDD